VLIDADQALKLYTSLARHSNYGKNLSRFLENLNVIDPTNMKYASEITKIMKNLESIEMYEGIFKFLTSKNISFEEFSKKVILKPYI
jgi:hypothetical protein